jgi:peroxiredoxin Q/BCP
VLVQACPSSTAPEPNHIAGQGKENPIMATLQTGDPAPDFSAPDQNDTRVNLADFKGRKLFIFFYPKANTGG